MRRASDFDLKSKGFDWSGVAEITGRRTVGRFGALLRGVSGQSPTPNALLSTPSVRRRNCTLHIADDNSDTTAASRVRRFIA